MTIKTAFPFGVDYYPEHWPEERWAVDAGLMAEAGFNTVRLADFAWSRIESEPGQYDFAWLDRAIQVLSQAGMRVILATPTASPPAWLMSRCPQAFRMREDGLTVTYGNRREYCPTSSVYREAARQIVGAMAGRYGSYPAVIGWQIDNEFGDRCYCPVCRQAFQDWLCRKYGSLDRMNERWGTVFWSHTYTAWEQIPVPLKTGRSPNPGLALDFSRFASEAYVTFQRVQVEILRERCPGQFVLHDCMGFEFDQIDYFELARDLDFVSLNYYPRDQWKFWPTVDPSRTALQHDTMRGLKRKNHWITEQQAGPGGWEILSVTPRPGEMRLWAYQGIAHGADAVLFFRWRTARYGTEQFWYGLLDQAAQPSRRYTEAKQMGAELRQAGSQLLGTAVKPQAAILLSYDSRFAFQIQPNNPQFHYPDHFREVYKAFHRLQIPMDVIHPEADLAGYRLVAVPALFVLSEAAAQNLKAFVEAGGTLLVTQRSGVKDACNAVVELPFPGLLREICGVQVEEVDSFAAGMSNRVEFCAPDLDAGRPEVGPLCEILAPTTARTAAVYTGDFYAGRPAITHNRFGLGQVVYAGAAGDETLYTPLAGWLARLAGLKAAFEVPEGVEACERWQGDRRILFLLNHTGQKQQVRLDREAYSLLDQAALLAGTHILDPYDVLILSDTPDPGRS